MKYRPIPKEQLEKLYVKEQRSTREIGRLLKCDGETVRLRLREHGIPVRRAGPILRMKLKLPKDKCALAYLAGIVDGEGSIFMGSSPNSVDGRNPTVSVRNTHLGLIEWLLQFGGRKHTEHPIDSRTGKANKTSYHWIVAGPVDVRELLIAILPYLIIKKAKAWTVLPECHRRIALWLRTESQ